MKKILLLIFSFIVCSGGVSILKAENLPVFSGKQGETLTISISSLPPYFYFEDTIAKGFWLDSLKKTLDKMEYKYKFVQHPFVRGVLTAKEGDVHAVLAPAKVKERKAFLFYPDEPMGITHWGFFINSSTKHKYNSYEDFKGKNIGTMRGYWLPQPMKDFWSDPANKVNLREVSQEKQNFIKIAAGRLDYLSSELNVGNYYIHSINASEKIKFLSDKMHLSCNQYLTFSQKVVNPLFVKKFSDELVKFKASKDYQDLIKKYNIQFLNFKKSDITWTYLE